MSRFNASSGLQIGGIDVSDFVVEQGTNYMRYNKGIQICWGVVPAPGSIQSYTVTLPAAFVNGEYVVTWGFRDSTSTNGTSVRVFRSSNRNGTTFQTTTFESVPKVYIAVGYWK